MPEPALILIVDDDSDFCKTLSDILLSKGYRTVVRETGAGALADLASQPPAVALIDLRLADMSGVALITAIRAQSPDTECIVLTGHASQKSAIDALNAGAYGYLAKPCDTRELLLMVERAVDKQRNTQAMRDYAERLNILRGIDHAILTARSSNEHAAAVIAHLHHVIPFDLAAVLSFDWPTRQATGLAAHGDPRVVALQAGQHTPIELLGLADTLFAGKLQAITDLPTVKRLAPVDRLLAERGFRSLLRAPLLAQSELIGTLTLASQTSDAFTRQHGEILREVAVPLAVALHQSRLYQQIQRHAEELESRVAERTATLSQVNAELARASRLKDEFLAAMSHELRTPLNAILGLAEALQEGVYGEADERQLRSLRTIEESGRHLLTLINDILDISKIEAGKLSINPRPLSIQAVCESSMRLIRQTAHKKRIDVSLDIEPGAKIMVGDERRIKQILVNLLSNALKFTPDGGRVGLDVTAYPDVDLVEFAVWDTGIGIRREDFERLFEPFMQVDSSLARYHTGTGLGLTLVRKLAELHLGGVRVESELGHGSRFTVSLPWPVHHRVLRRGGNTGPLDLPDNPPPPRDTAPLVLVTDDRDSNIDLLHDYLTAHGLRVARARSGYETLELCNELTPDLILMDIQMPGMDGIETIRHLQKAERTARIPVIALTALAMPGDRERCLNAGAVDYLAKPVHLKGLRDMIAHYTTAAQPAPLTPP